MCCAVLQNGNEIQINGSHGEHGRMGEYKQNQNKMRCVRFLSLIKSEVFSMGMLYLIQMLDGICFEITFKK